jgi:acyl carrier protein
MSVSADVGAKCRANDGEETMNSTEDCLRDILIEHLFVEIARDQILATASLRNDLGLDSLGFVELKDQVEKRFGIAISEDEFTPENFATISTLSSLIGRRCTGRQSALQ